MEDTFHADQIREELRARTVVRDLKEPALIVEGEKPSSLDSGAPEWELVNVLDVRAANKENNSTTATSTMSSGLRQRNNKGGGTGDAKKADDQTSSPKMTEELQVDEEEMLIQRDTLNLFAGVRPTDLKSAQKHAKVALASYIEAANRAAQILTQLGEAKGTK